MFGATDYCTFDQFNLRFESLLCIVIEIPNCAFTNIVNEPCRRICFEFSTILNELILCHYDWENPT